MDSADQFAQIKPSKNRFARAVAKVLHIRAATGISREFQPSKSDDNVMDDMLRPAKLEFLNEDDENLRNKAATEALLAKTFACISTVKAAYAQLQSAQAPYDPDAIESADNMVVSELKILSELKQCYLRKQYDNFPLRKILPVAEMQEQKSLLETYEIVGKKLDSEIKLKDSEIMFLKEKLQRANRENKLLEKSLNSSGKLAVLDNLHFSRLYPSHFILYLQLTKKSIQRFVRLLIREMESAGWNLHAAASSIESCCANWKMNDLPYVFESFVFRVMFDGFDQPNFSITNESISDQRERQKLFFNRFMEMKSTRVADYLSCKPTSLFARFCRIRYLRLIHPKMELSLFGNLDQRYLANSGGFPETTFFKTYAKMAWHVWLLHCLAFSFDPAVSIFQVSRGSRFSEVYMESETDEALFSDPSVAFTVVPGFKIGKTIMQCQVYLYS